MRAKKPGTDPAQCRPRFWYICVVNSGNAKPNNDRNTAFAARTDAAKMVYASIR